MTPEQLLEEVAREIAAARGIDPDMPSGMPEFGPLAWQVWVDEARAALAVAIEACAKVAEEELSEAQKEQVTTGFGAIIPGSELMLIWGRNRAVAIRALKPKD